MIVAVASQKGGVGKTSTAISLSAGVAKKGSRVLLVDLDPQANSSKVLVKQYQSLQVQDTVHATVIHRAPLPVHRTNRENLDIVASHILLSEATLSLTIAKDHREARLKTALDEIQAKYDFVFIDCPPSLGWLTLNAFTAADKILVVTSPGFFELDSLVQLGKVIEEVREYYNPRLRLLGFLFTMSDPTVSSRESLKLLRQTYTHMVLKTVVPRNVDLRDASFNQQDIFAYNVKAKAAEAYQSLIKELGL